MILSPGPGEGGRRRAAASKYDKRYLQELRNILLIQRDVFAQAVREASQVPGRLQPRACPVCDTPPATKPLIAPRGGLPFWTCADCGLVFMSPVLADDAREHVLGFVDSNPVMRRYWDLRLEWAGRVDAKLDPASDPQLKQILRYKRSGCLLDIGCGLGEFLRNAAYFFEAAGVEINPRLRRAALALGVNVAAPRIEDLPDRPQFDVITLNQVLYGLTDPIGLLGHARRRLREDGIIYINTPNADSLAIRIFRSAHCHFLCTNLNVFNLRSFQRLADRVGLRLIDWHTEWLDLYPGDLFAQWFFPERSLHRRNSFIPFYCETNRLIDWLDRKLLYRRLEKRGDYLVAVLAHR